MSIADAAEFFNDLPKIANLSLYQLSYIPVRCAEYIYSKAFRQAMVGKNFIWF